MFNVGDRVSWTDRIHRRVGRAIGTVINVIPSDSGLADSILYDVMFAFGPRTVHGSELRAVATNTFSCALKEELFTAYTTATDVYCRLACKLMDAVGQIAHSEFEFLLKQVESARHLTTEARYRLQQHRTEHGC